MVIMLTCDWYVVKGGNMTDLNEKVEEDKTINEQAIEAFKDVDEFCIEKIDTALAKFGFNNLKKYKPEEPDNVRGIYIFTVYYNNKLQTFKDDWNKHIKKESKIPKLNSKKTDSKHILHIKSAKELKKQLLDIKQTDSKHVIYIESAKVLKKRRLNIKKRKNVLYVGSSNKLSERLSQHYSKPEKNISTYALKLDDDGLNKYTIECYYATTKDHENVTIKMVESILYEKLEPVIGLNR